MRKVDIFSLQFRLTIGIAAFSILGLGSLAIWTSWKMQNILIDSHKENIIQIAKKLPRDIQLYSQMLPQEKAISTAISNLSVFNTFIWIAGLDNQVLAKSETLNNISNKKANKLISLSDIPIKPKVTKIGDRYFVLCSGTLLLEGQQSKLMVAQDITRDQIMFMDMMRSLSIASILVIVVLSGALALYIKRSLQPLCQLSCITQAISADELGTAQIYLDNAPSEVKDLAQTCNMMLSRLSESWQKEQNFVSNVSHELRTPLTVVHGYLQSVLKRQQNLTQTQKEALETADSEAQNTIHLLQELLELARADSGHLHFHISDCVVNDLVAEVVEMAGKYSDRLLTIAEKTYPIEVKADYNRLKQVLLNLIDNAIKYSPADTPIILQLDQAAKSGIIQVCDSGYGIPLQQQALIFERFYRGYEARNRAGGSGLGLSIVKTLVEGMGGSVSVRSKFRAGSVFTVILPRADT